MHVRCFPAEGCGWGTPFAGKSQQRCDEVWRKPVSNAIEERHWEQTEYKAGKLTYSARKVSDLSLRPISDLVTACTNLSCSLLSIPSCAQELHITTSCACMKQALP